MVRTFMVVFCRLDGFEGEVKMDADEVQAVQWKSLSDLVSELHTQPNNFTPWLRAELGMLKDVLNDQ
jgi:isopentenyldiphosphate isomerase